MANSCSLVESHIGQFPAPPLGGSIPPVVELPGPGSTPGGFCILSSLEQTGPSQGEAHTIARNRKEKHSQGTKAPRTPLCLVSAHVSMTAQEMHTQERGVKADNSSGAVRR